MALKPSMTSYYNTIHHNVGGEHLQRIGLKPRIYINHQQLRFTLIRPFPREKHTQPHYAIVYPSAYTPPTCKPAEESDADYPTPAIRRRTQRFSATCSRTSLALGKLHTRRKSPSSVSATSTSNIADLGRVSLIYTGGTASLYQTVA